MAEVLFGGALTGMICRWKPKVCIDLLKTGKAMARATLSLKLLISCHFANGCCDSRPETGSRAGCAKRGLAKRTLDAVHDANIKVSEAVTQYGKAVATKDPQEVQKAKNDYDRAQGFLAKVQKTLASKTKDLQLGKLDTNGSGMIELLPVAPGGPNGKGKQFNRKIVHVKSTHPAAQGWRAFPIDHERASASSQRRNVAGSQSHESESIFARDPATGKRSLDHKKMMKQISAIKPEIKAEFIKFDDVQFNGIIEDWALSWNYKKEGQSLNGHFKDNIDTSRQAQTMRYMAGVGAAVVYDPSGGKLGLKAEAKAEFAVAEGKASIAFYAPHRIGWVLHFQSPTTGKLYPLGSMRAKIEAVLAGVAGASVVAELSTEIECSKLKIAMKGVTAPGAPPPTINRRRRSAGLGQDQDHAGQIRCGSVCRREGGRGYHGLAAVARSGKQEQECEPRGLHQDCSGRLGHGRRRRGVQA